MKFELAIQLCVLSREGKSKLTLLACGSSWSLHVTLLEKGDFTGFVITLSLLADVMDSIYFSLDSRFDGYVFR